MGLPDISALNHIPKLPDEFTGYMSLGAAQWQVNSKTISMDRIVMLDFDLIQHHLVQIFDNNDDKPTWRFYWLIINLSIGDTPFCYLEKEYPDGDWKASQIPIHEFIDDVLVQEQLLKQ